ncbi:MarR family transcriptional regulator [Microbacterium sp. ARD32]|uniref:MarR family winged helix-turn-helix transcriptional regulator n=1 Tax=Microbacterium sp. ARD32 TaxID=2962577 RepID=UPI002882A252|nr:MarR family transcriptional regulator [Microbacterium sp. ARD32]MDT0156977.1 MarR family transcriptional regulator [Microbacterium sp. ARD32]
MQKADVIPSIVLSAHVLARIAAQDAGNEAPSAQWRALSILERQGGMRIGELAAAARTTQPGMTRLIGALEHAGLVTRSADPADTRATLVTATAHGLTQLTHWRAELRDTLAPRFADLGEQEWSALHRAAEILAAHAQEPDRTGEPA